MPATDARILVLRFLRKRPLFIALTSTFLLTACAIAGLLIEQTKCFPALKLWLEVLVGRSVTRFIFHALLSFAADDVNVETLAIPFLILRSNAPFLIKVVELLDVFGIIWFSVGNLLVFNNFDCATVSPIVFYTSLFYIIITYVSFIGPTLIRCSLNICPSLGGENEHEELFGNFLGNHDENNRNNYEVLPTFQTSQFKVWLETFQCHEFLLFKIDNFFDSHSGISQSWYAANHNNSIIADELTVKDKQSYVVNIDDIEAHPNDENNNNVGCKYDYIHHLNPKYSILSDIDYCAICLQQLSNQVFDNQKNLFSNLLESLHNNINNNNNNNSDVDESKYDDKIASLDKSISCFMFELNDYHDKINGDGLINSSTIPECGNNENDSSQIRMIVRYPCSSHHYFHTDCLHHWLGVANAKVRINLPSALNNNNPTIIDCNKLTCPICRLKPVIPHNNLNPNNNSSMPSHTSQNNLTEENLTSLLFPIGGSSNQTYVTIKNNNNNLIVSDERNEIASVSGVNLANILPSLLFSKASLVPVETLDEMEEGENSFSYNNNDRVALSVTSTGPGSMVGTVNDSQEMKI
eukprot:gene6104-8414_t